MKHDLFISYSNVDSACAQAVCRSLEQAGLRCWIAPRDIVPGSDWAEQIIDAMNAVRIMLFVFSASSNASQQVKREIERAVHKNLVVIPLRIENVLPSKSLEYFLSSQHWFDAFAQPLESYMEALANHVRAIAQQGHDTPPLALAEASSVRATPAPVAPRAASSAAPMVPVAPEALKFMETALADVIGPVAALLVKRAAAKAPDFDALTGLLAAELDQENDSKRFIETCRRYALQHRI